MSVSETHVSTLAVFSGLSGHSSDSGHSGMAASLCPRCGTQAARQVDATEWIKLYHCERCKWRYARVLGRSQP